MIINASGSSSTLGAAVTIGSDGAFTYDPGLSPVLQLLNAGETVADTFAYTISDGQGATDNATVTLTVTGTNVDPGDDTLIFDPANPTTPIAGGGGTDTLVVEGAGNALDFRLIPNNTITGIEIVDLTGTGDNTLILDLDDLLTLTNNADTLIVTGDAGDAIFTLDDGWANIGTVDVGGVAFTSYSHGIGTMLVDPDIDPSGIADTTLPNPPPSGNGAPVAGDDAFATDEDTAIAGNLLTNDSDPDGDALIINASGSSSTLGAAVTIGSDGAFTYDPGLSPVLQLLNAGETVADTFAYTISDGQGATDNATVTLTVTGTNVDPGDDTLIFDPANPTTPIAGGGGTDTLVVEGAGNALDFRLIPNNTITGIEIVDLTGTGDNTLILDLDDLLTLTNNADTLIVTGDAGDAIFTLDDGWANIGTVDVGGVAFTSYSHGIGTMLVDPDIDPSGIADTTLPNPPPSGNGAPVAGDDWILFDAADTLQIDGGSGTDTLQLNYFVLSAGTALDLTTIGDGVITGIERFDMTDGDNDLTLALNDVLALSDTTDTLTVFGDAGDSVSTADAGWTSAGTVNVGGTVFDSYTQGLATLLVDQDIDQTGILF